MSPSPVAVAVTAPALPGLALAVARRRMLAWILLLIGTAATGASPILVRLSEVGPVATGFWRLLISVPLLLPWLVIARRRGGAAGGDPVTGVVLIGLGLTGVFYAGDLGFWNLAVVLIPITDATLLADLAPVIVVLAGAAFLGERLTGRVVLGLVTALAGAALLVGGGMAVGAHRLDGDAYGLATAFFFGSYLLAVKVARRRISAPVVMVATGALGAALLLVTAVCLGEALLPRTATGWLAVASLAVVCQVAGQSSIAQALSDLPAGAASVTMLLQPVAAAFLGWAILGEPIRGVQILGGAVVLAGVSVLARRQK